MKCAIAGAARVRGGIVDHRPGRINALNLTNGADPFGERAGETSGPAPDVQHVITAARPAFRRERGVESSSATAEEDRVEEVVSADTGDENARWRFVGRPGSTMGGL